MRILLTILFLLQGCLVVFAQRSRLLPDLATVQYAGSIGFISAGVGYDVLRNHELSLHYGYVPKARGGELNIVAAKLIFTTYTLNLSRNVTIHPLNAGLMISYHLGSQFRSQWPADRYPEGYYWWKTSLRAHLLTQSSVTFRVNSRHIQSLSCYVELNTNELYLISFAKNRHSLTLTDIIKVGYGVRARF